MHASPSTLHSAASPRLELTLTLAWTRLSQLTTSRQSKPRSPPLRLRSSRRANASRSSRRWRRPGRTWASSETPDDDGRISVTREPRTYNPTTGPSFLSDLYAAQRTGDSDALERLRRNNEEVRASAPVEARASLTTSDFYRPIYASDQWIPTYRPRMVYAGLVKQLPLTTYGETVSIPKYTAPTDAASFQAGDNAALTTNAGSTSQLTTVVVTAGGYLDIARQALERATPGLDEVIFSDLARDIARKTEIGCLAGNGSNAPNGVMVDSNVPAVTVTGQTINQFLLKLADLSQRIETAIGECPDFILMHPRRWAWLESLVDATTNRPVIVPTSQGPYNASAWLPRRTTRVRASRLRLTLPRSGTCSDCRSIPPPQ